MDELKSLFQKFFIDIIPFIISFFIMDILEYKNSIFEGLTSSSNHRIILERQDLLSFLIGFTGTAFITGLNNTLHTYPYFPIFWFSMALVSSLSMKPLVVAKESHSPKLFKVKKKVIRFNAHLVVLVSIFVFLTELLAVV